MAYLVTVDMSDLSRPVINLVGYAKWVIEDHPFRYVTSDDDNTLQGDITEGKHPLYTKSVLVRFDNDPLEIEGIFELYRDCILIKHQSGIYCIQGTILSLEPGERYQQMDNEMAMRAIVSGEDMEFINDLLEGDGGVNAKPLDITEQTSLFDSESEPSSEDGSLASKDRIEQCPCDLCNDTSNDVMEDEDD